MSETTLIHDPSTNVPDYAAEESARLAREYAEVDRNVTDALADARALPPEVADVDTANLYTKTIGRLKDLDDRIEKIRIGEGLPHLRKKDSVDSFFFRMRERLFRRKKTDASGGGDVLMARLHAYNSRRLEEERQARLKVEADARAAEEALRQERLAAEQRQRDAEAREARARKAENKDAAAAAAAVAQEEADRLAAQEETARAVRQDATAAAQAKPADLVRERHQGGAMNTMRMVWHVEIEDSMKLDALALWAFVKDDAKLAALKSWAKTTNHKKAMPGAIIEERPDTQVRR